MIWEFLEHGLSMHKPEVQVFGPKIRKFDGDLVDLLCRNWNGILVGHDDALVQI